MHKSHVSLSKQTNLANGTVLTSGIGVVNDSAARRFDGTIACADDALAVSIEDKDRE